MIEADICNGRYSISSLVTNVSLFNHRFNIYKSYLYECSFLSIIFLIWVKWNHLFNCVRPVIQSHNSPYNSLYFYWPVITIITHWYKELLCTSLFPPSSIVLWFVQLIVLYFSDGKLKVSGNSTRAGEALNGGPVRAPASISSVIICCGSRSLSWERLISWDKRTSSTSTSTPYWD